MGGNGEEKLLAVARHIAQALGHSHPNHDDILQIFSHFDGRFSRDKLSSDRPPPPPESDPMAVRTTTTTLAALQHSLKSLHRRISQYVAAPHPIWSDSADSAAFLDSIDELHATIRHWNSMAGDKSVNACLDRAEDLLQQAMFRLEDEFKTLMQHGVDSYSRSRSRSRSLEIESKHNTARSANASASDDDGGGVTEDDSESCLDDESEIPIAKPVVSSESDYYDIAIDGLPSSTIADLNDIARRMVAAGFGKECSHAYSLCRRDFLEESLSRLGLQEKLSAHQVQTLPWSQLEEEIERWSRAAFVVLRILFPSERRLCDRVFSGLSSSAASDLSFMEVCRASATHLLNFADAVAIGSRSPERLFKILDLFETLRDLIPDFEALFAEDPYCVFLRTEAVAVWKRLGDAIRATFMELEHLISRDPAKAPIPAGRLHPITRYVMNYLRAACRSRQTLHQIFDDNYAAVYATKTADDRPPPIPPPPTATTSSSSSSVSVQIAWIMELLESNLEAKSNLYRDPALCSIFLLNNQRYIVQKVKDSHELESLLGDDWVRKHSAKARLYAANYQRNSWSKALSALKLDTNAASASNSKPVSMRERLNSFNACFDENCKVQSAWVIFDEQGREDLRKTIAGTLVPAYRSFMAKFQGGGAEPGKPAERSGRCYSAEEVEAKIGELFRGSTGSSNGGGARK